MYDVSNTNMIVFI